MIHVMYHVNHHNQVRVHRKAKNSPLVWESISKYCVMLAYDRLNLDPISCEPGILTNTLPSHLHTCTNIPISNQEAEHLNISSIVLSQNRVY